MTLAWLHDAHGYYMKNFSFPGLVEVRDYLKMHHVDNVASIGDLFPNLAVIRAERLDNKYALQIADCQNIETIGLANLRYIGKGNIQIKENPSLCFVQTVSWKAIALNTNPTGNDIQASSITKFSQRKQFVIHCQSFRFKAKTAQAAILSQNFVGAWDLPSGLAIHLA